MQSHRLTVVVVRDLIVKAKDKYGRAGKFTIKESSVERALFCVRLSRPSRNFTAQTAALDHCTI